MRDGDAFASEWTNSKFKVSLLKLRLNVHGFDQQPVLLLKWNFQNVIRDQECETLTSFL